MHIFSLIPRKTMKKSNKKTIRLHINWDRIVQLLLIIYNKTKKSTSHRPTFRLACMEPTRLNKKLHNTN